MPLMQFSDIVSRVESIASVRDQGSLIKDAIQWGLHELCAGADLPYLMTDGVIQTAAPYETGTVSITSGAKAVTGSGTTFTAAMVGMKIRFQGETAYYTIASCTSATSITLNEAYQADDDASAVTYSIYQDVYRLAPDLDTYKMMRELEEGSPITGIPSSVFDMLVPAPEAEGEPKYQLLAGTKLDTSTTGTISGNAQSNTLTGSGTSWTSVEGLSKGSRITIGTLNYTVKTVDSDTQITTYEKISTTISAGTSYTIWLDNMRVQFYTIPSALRNIYYRYQRVPYPLVDDEDIPDIPEQWAHILINAGLMVAWETKDKEQALVHRQLFERKKRDFHRRAGAISRHTIFRRMSQDALASNGISSPMPSGYGIPIPR